jgi:hypothetical protein
MSSKVRLDYDLKFNTNQTTTELSTVETVIKPFFHLEDRAESLQVHPGIIFIRVG